jgi:hypothetical protein
VWGGLGSWSGSHHTGVTLPLSNEPASWATQGLSRRVVFGHLETGTKGHEGANIDLALRSNMVVPCDPSLGASIPVPDTRK